MSTTEGTLTNTPTMEIIASGDKGIVDDGNAVVLEEPLLLEAGTDGLDPFLEGISYVTQNKLAANSGHHAFSYVLQVTERTQVEAEMQPIIGGLYLGLLMRLPEFALLGAQRQTRILDALMERSTNEAAHGSAWVPFFEQASQILDS